ncbi:hypothetical protein [Glycomyces paridis]|uniref:Uncharacterized protein n=1 Tax=Glycomyces paridis TaxID=2126555 RepID=A0A4V4HPP8_9ACTN|nr:hypothetical protein [Glycomyces paridis]THV30766.1 hypothetical protein E9998_05125 [Glycomyces paridis]
MSDLSLAARRYRLGLGMFTEGVKYFAGWIVAAVVLAFLVPFIIGQWADVSQSGWYHAANVGKICTAIVGGGFLYTMMPTMIAQGVTRRELATATGLFGLLWSAALGLVAIAGFLVEHAYYGLLDWTQGIDQDTPLPLESYGHAFEFAAHYPLVFALYFTGGALVSAAIYRSDSGWLVLIPVIPIGLALDDLLSSSEPWGPGWMVRFVTGLADDVDPWIGAVLTAAFIVLGAWITRRLILDSAIRAKQA